MILLPEFIGRLKIDTVILSVMKQVPTHGASLERGRA